MNVGALYNGALGNRAWGGDNISKWVGLFFMAFGTWLHHPLPLYGFFLYLISLYIFRSTSSAGWLDMETDHKDWIKSLIRSAFILPHGLLVSYLTMSIIPFIVASAVVFLIPLVYYLTGLQTKYDATAISEPMVGLLVSTI